MSRQRRNPTLEERTELWKRWKAGESLSDIARALERKPGTIHGFVSATGGYAPQHRIRRACALSLGEREEISRALSAGVSLRTIASALGRAPSTISREVGRNGGRTPYRASKADDRAAAAATRPKVCKLASQPRLRQLVAAKLQLDWSPEQISGWLRAKYPGETMMNVSHETIYRSLFVQARGVLKKELAVHLRTRRTMRRSKSSSTAGQNRGQIRDAISIRERPADVEDRAVPGHWEGDLISGSKNSHVATLVERHSRFTMLVKVGGKDAQSVASALAREVRRLPVELRRSLTWDRGTEMAQHREFSLATNVKVYFCDPQSPWQRGSNENTNRLLRQYFPRGSNLSTHSQSALNRFSRRLNQRPRRTLGYDTPANMLQRALR